MQIAIHNIHNLFKCYECLTSILKHLPWSWCLLAVTWPVKGVKAASETTVQLWMLSGGRVRLPQRLRGLKVFLVLDMPGHHQ